MRILLVGANGQVGHELRRSLAPLGHLPLQAPLGRFTGLQVAAWQTPDVLSTVGMLENQHSTLLIPNQCHHPHQKAGVGQLNVGTSAALREKTRRRTRPSSTVAMRRRPSKTPTWCESRK